jgi:hypothetical protein
MLILRNEPHVRSFSSSDLTEDNLETTHRGEFRRKDYQQKVWEMRRFWNAQTPKYRFSGIV